MAKKTKQTADQPAVPATYFQTRMNEYNFGPNFNKKFNYFEESKTGDIIINYPSLNYDKANSKTRFNPDKNLKYTYHQDQKGNFLFFPPKILEAYADKTKVETLYLTIGEFKAASADANGLHIIGLSNKNAFAQGEDLHPELVAIIEQLEVENLVFILDADVFKLEWNAEEEPDKDLAQNIYRYFYAATELRKIAKGKVKSIYLSILRNRFLKNGKGIDDLFNEKKGSEHQVIEDAKKFTAAKVYFSTINLSIETLGVIKSHFHINFNKNVPQGFYQKFAHIIEEKEFVFNRGRYKWDIAFDGLIMTKHADSDKFKRIGCDFFKIINVPNSKKILERKLIGWKCGEIERDYVKGEGVKNFFRTIEKYEDFCNVPENNPDKYEQVIEGCYNLYFPLEHKPEIGDFPKTEAFLKHIFGERKLISGHTNYELALDWLTILYREPIRKLPAICLVSKEKLTGKSSFLFWLREIFNENATVIGNNEINDKFNDDYIGKLVIGVDESFIEKKLIQETIKSQITNEKGKMQGKYTSRRDIPFIAKYVMTSNNEKNFMQIDDDENRFWVNRVPPFPKNDENPLLVNEMKAEISAFLYFLNTRKVLHPYKNRLYFAPDLLVTDALNAVRNSSQDWLEKELRETMKELFFHYQYHTLYFSITELEDILNGKNASAKFRKSALREKLEDVFKLNNHKDLRVSQPSNPKMWLNENISFEPKRGRLYTFKVEDFFTEDYLINHFEYYTIDDIQKFRNTNLSESKEALGI